MNLNSVEHLESDKSSDLLKDLMVSKDIDLTEQEKIALANEFVDGNEAPLPPIKFSLQSSKPLSFKPFKFKAGTEVTCRLIIEERIVETWKETIGKAKKETKL